MNWGRGNLPATTLKVCASSGSAIRNVAVGREWQKELNEVRRLIIESDLRRLRIRTRDVQLEK
jgi:hypothetical protein